jgi:hypothetical protein
MCNVWCAKIYRWPRGEPSAADPMRTYAHMNHVDTPFLALSHYKTQTMTLPNPGYLILYCHAYLNNVHVIREGPCLYIFNVAVPSITPDIEHPLEQPILACSLHFLSKTSLGQIPSGVYHIFEKVSTSCKCSENMDTD